MCGTNHAGGRCAERDRSLAKSFKGLVILTTAHLNHNTRDSRRRNLKSLCQKCHLAYDADFHAFNAVITRDAKRGQLRLPIEDRFEERETVML